MPKLNPKIILAACLISTLLPEVFAKTRIMGRARCSEHQMRSYLKQQNPKINKKFLELPRLFLEEGKKEGVRGDIAFAQSLRETGFFKFGGDVRPEENNFAGIGVVNNGAQGNTFKTQREGVRAQIQHLKAYASNKKLNGECIDPRFSYVKRGSAPCVEDLAGCWAYPGFDTKKYKTLKMAQKKRDTYGHAILRHYRNMLKLERVPKKLPKGK